MSYAGEGEVQKNAVNKQQTQGNEVRKMRTNVKIMKARCAMLANMNARIHDYE